MKRKKMLALIVSLGLVFSMTTGYAYGTSRVDNNIKKERKRPEKVEAKTVNLDKLSLPTNYPDGEFFGSAEGYSGEIEVRVVVKEGRIVELEVIRQTETPGYYENGALVIGKVLEKGDLNVDTISGATITSHAILKAAAKALGASVPDKAVVKTTTPPMPARESLDFENLKDGKWQGSAQGYADILTVEVAIEKGKIVGVTYLSGRDDEPYLTNAKTILSKIVANQGTKGIDVFSGATYTSLGLINATNQALKKASGQSKESGGEVESYKLQLKKLNEELENLKARFGSVVLEDGEGLMKDGTYEGSAIGYNGEILMEVTISDGKLKEAKIKKHTDDKEYMDKVELLLSEVVKHQGTKGVDTISGATFSSNGILGGVSNALRLSRGLEPISSGGSAEQVTRLNKEIERLKEQLKTNASADITGPLKDGEYSAKASGYGGLVEIILEVKDQKIKSVKLGTHNEDSEYVDMARGILDKIVELGTTKGIDTVSGATYTSNGILNATKNAMAKASGEKVAESTSAGDTELISKEKYNQLESELLDLKDKISAFNKANAKSASDMADGEYTGYGKGYANRLIKATLTVKDKKITKIDLVHREDRGAYLSETREAQMINTIIERNGTEGVDTITGATLSTSGIIQAVNDALKGGGGTSGDSGLLDSLNQVITSLKESIMEIFTDRKDFVMEVAKLEADLPLADGEYTGYGIGWSKTRDGKSDDDLSEAGNPPPYNIVTSTVRIENGMIVEIISNEPSSRRSRAYLNLARDIHDTIIDDNGVGNVDIKTGATYSSRGILEAVNMALSKSKEAYKVKQSLNTDNETREALEQLRRENEVLRQELEALKNTNG